ncbi:MAG: molybdopterin-dependent oxidoreductase [bacterium]
MGIKRRKFLQLTGLTAAGTMLSSCGKGTEKLIPFLIPPDDGSIPGVANYFASACRQCPAGCGILVRVAEGRAKKIEGNPLHPVNKGKICARGQAALQDLYHPDRVRQPMKRVGAKGSGEFTPISWDEGLSLLLEQLNDLKKQGHADRLLFMTPRLQGTLSELVWSFMSVYGSPHHLAYEMLNTESYEQANVAVCGRGDVPDYDLEKTQYLLSFGADFLETYLSPVRYGNAFGKMRQSRPTIRGAFTYVGARMSMTAASADRWLPVNVGQEGVLALGMARLILEQGLYSREMVKNVEGNPEVWMKKLSDYDLHSVAERTGLAPEEITSIARDFATIQPSLALVGDSVVFQSNGQDAVQAIQFLNLLVGNVGQPGGLLFCSPPVGQGSTSSFANLLSKVDALERDEFHLALVYRTNPVHGLPSAIRFQEAFKRVPFVVSFSSIMDDTAMHADLILPDHTDLESWGDVVPWVGAHSQVTGILQPVVNPLYDTRSFGDVLLAAARGLDGEGEKVLPYKNYLDMLKQRVQRLIDGSSDTASEKNWVEILQRGGLFEQEEAVLDVPQKKGVSPVPVREPYFEGNKEAYPFHLALFASPVIYDGRNAHLPWLQEMPDPMTTAVWGAWVEINPKTAESLGIKHGDLVMVESTQGSVQVPAVIFPAIRPDTVAIPMGQGHHGMGRYADKVGVNPLGLLAPVMDKEHVLPAWGATRVRLTRISDKGDLTVMGHPEGSYRGELLEI